MKGFCRSAIFTLSNALNVISAYFSNIIRPFCYTALPFKMVFSAQKSSISNCPTLVGAIFFSSAKPKSPFKIFSTFSAFMLCESFWFSFLNKFSTLARTRMSAVSNVTIWAIKLLFTRFACKESFTPKGNKSLLLINHNK